MTDLTDLAIAIPMNASGLTINTGRDGTWLHFKAADGLCASFNVEAMATERSGPIVARALRSWCSDRFKQAGRIIDEENARTGKGPAPAAEPKSSEHP